MLLKSIFLVIIYVTLVSSRTVTVTSTRNSQAISTTSSEPSYSDQTAAVTGCHMHGSEQFCIDNEGNEGLIVPSPSNTQNDPSSYTGCHSHGSETFCLDSLGEEYQFVLESDTSSEASSSSSSSSGGEHCHFHAGVEHCIGEGESEHDASAQSCERVDRDYDIPLRIGLLFVILVTSAIGSFGPLLFNRFFKFSLDGLIITILKQFGTGVIISTAFVHLMTHADLMWGNSCISLEYEATATSITMAGIFLAFFIEYLGIRIVNWKLAKYKKAYVTDDETYDKSSQKEEVSPRTSDEHEDQVNQATSPKDTMSVMLLEAGIVFHSILVGITLVVAGDSFFITLFIVILFHQMFEGIALGARIAELKNTELVIKLIMAAIFAVITPIGMAIGIGVLNQFNGNDPSTIIALGTLDSFSAGILIWTGIIEMWAHDWLFGNLASASFVNTICSLIALLTGMILMSLLGKWA